MVHIFHGSAFPFVAKLCCVVPVHVASNMRSRLCAPLRHLSHCSLEYAFNSADCSQLSHTNAMITHDGEF